MPKAAFYAVQKGRKTGIFSSWEECEPLINGFVGAKHKKFNRLADAEAFIAAGSSSNSAMPPRTQPSTSSSLENVVVYCDGACKSNGKDGATAGIGVWWGHDDPRNLAERCPGVQTNNRAELIASTSSMKASVIIVQVLQAIARVLETAPHNSKRLVIKTDSQYSTNCLGLWLSSWERKGFVSSKGEPVKNAALVRYVSALMNARSLKGQPVLLVKVEGHSGIEGNEAADALANLGATMLPLKERDWEQLRYDLDKESKTSSANIQPASLKIETGEQGTDHQKLSITHQELELYAAGLADPEELEKDLED